MKRLKFLGYACALITVGLSVQGCSADLSAATDPPRVATSETDWQLRMLSCLTDAGWTVEGGDDGGIGPASPVPTAQFPAYEKALQACSSSVPSLTYADLAVEGKRHNYDALVAAAECLEAGGFASADVPTFQAFDDAGGVWTPFVAVPLESFDAAEETCPQPSGW